MAKYDKVLQKQIIEELKVPINYSAKLEKERRVEFLRRFLRSSRLDGFVLGISGGQDSTLAGKLAQIAVELENKKLIALRMPYGEQKDAADVDLAIKFIEPSIVHELNIKIVTDSLCSSFKEVLGEQIADFNKGNVKARMRMVVQYAIAAKENMAVIGTDHASESLMGFFTKYGDGAADLLPLYGLSKFQGREMLKLLDCPTELYLKQPTADLLDCSPLRPDEDELGVPYTVIEDFLTGKPVSDANFTVIIDKFNKTRHKRGLPITMWDLPGTASEVEYMPEDKQKCLKGYEYKEYEQQSIAIEMVIFTVRNEEPCNYRKLAEKKLQVLLVKRREEPYKGMWALPGGFVKPNENLEEAARRELKGETNIDNVYMEQLYTWGEVNKDIGTRVISTSYVALVDSSLLANKASDGAQEAKWFNVKNKLLSEIQIPQNFGYCLERLFQLSTESEEDKLSAEVRVQRVVCNRLTRIERQVINADRIAFDHAKILHYCLERLRNKVEYTNIAFSLMPEYFSLTELQKVYETILDKELLAANFRRKIADMVIKTDQHKVDTGHRPSRLYKFNQNWTEEKL